MLFRRTWIGCVAIGLGLFALTGCEEREVSERRRSLVVACPAQSPPYSYRVGDAIEGIEVALMDIVAECLGRTLEVHETAFPDLFSELSSGKADVAAACLAITEERRERACFSVPYITGGQVIVVPESSTVASMAELKGKRVGVARATTGNQLAVKAGTEPVYFDTQEDLLMALRNGEVEAVVTDRRPAEFFVRQASGLRFTSLHEEAYSFAFAKEDVSLRDQVNVLLDAMRSMGILQRIVARYEASAISGPASPTVLAVRSPERTKESVELLLGDAALNARLEALAQKAGVPGRRR